MDVIFEGALSRSWGMEDVLRAVMGVENQPFGILRISGGQTINGRLSIADGQFIVSAASFDGSYTGYDAVRKLLSAREGNFAFLDTGGQRPRDGGEALYLSLEKVLASLPELPVEPAQLFDEKSLLDRVFGMGAMIELPSSTPTRLVSVKAMPPMDGSGGETRQAPITTWNLRDSRPETEAIAPGKGAGAEGWPAGQKADSMYPDFEGTGDHRPGMERLRQERPSLPWYKELIRESVHVREAAVWIAIIALLSLMTIFLLVSIVKQHNSLTIQKGSRPHSLPSRTGTP